MAHLDFYFDFSCPFAYIGATQIEAIANRHGAGLTWKPMLLGGVFRGTGLADSPMQSMSPAKARHNAQDMVRWAAHYDIPLSMPAAHPMSTVRALRALLALPEDDWPRVIAALYRAYWVDNVDITRAETIATVLAGAGIERAAIDTAVAANDEPRIKDELRARTDEAVSRGIFGAPTTFVRADGEPDSAALMLWGQDRLHMVEAALSGWRPGKALPAQAAARTPATSGELREVHFWYDFSSPFAYLGATQIERVAQDAGATLRWRPMLLGAVFKQVGQVDVPLSAMVDAKRKYIGRELDYWSSYWQVPFRFTSRFPMRTVTALRLALLAGDKIGPLSHHLFRALWVDDRDLNDEGLLRAILTEHGFDASEMLARTQEPATKQLLIDNTSEAVAAGAFGAPTCIVYGRGEPQLYWGQDRLSLVGDALRG